MKTAEWQERITKTVERNGGNLDEMAELGFYLLIDTELTPDEKCELINKTVSGCELNLGMILVRAKVYQGEKAFRRLLSLLPTRYYDSNHILFTKICQWFEILASDARPVQLPTLSINKNTPIAELALICDIITSLANHKVYPLKILTISSELHDERMIPALAILFKYARSVSLINCKLSALSVHILKTARTLADKDYQVKDVTVRNVEVDFNVLDQFTTWLSGSANCYRVEISKEGKLYLNATPGTIARLEVEIADGTFTSTQCTQLLQSLPSKTDKHIIMHACLPRDLIISDVSVKALTIESSRVTPDMFHEDAYLKFISSMTGVTELILRGLTFEDISARMSIIEQSFRIPGLTRIVLDFPLNDADMSFILKLLNYNTRLTHLSFSSGHFSEAALLLLAKTLVNANQSLVELTLPTWITIPSDLNIVLKSIKLRKKLIDEYRDVQRIIREVNQFAESVNDHTDARYLCREWENLLKAHEMCQRLKEASFPSVADAIRLHEGVAVSFSYFIAQKMLRTDTLNPLQLMVVRKTSQNSYESSDFEDVTILQKLTPQFTNPQFYFTFYSNLFIFCDHLYKILISSHEPVSEEIPHEQMLKKINVISKSSSFQSMVTLASNAAILKHILLCIPPDNNLYYHEINQMLFTLMQHKVLVLLADCISPDIVSLANTIIELNELRDLAVHLNTFLDELPVLEKVKLPFWRLSASENSEFLDPRLNAIIAIANARDEIVKIFNARKLPVGQVVSPLSPPQSHAVLQSPPVPLNYLPPESPATFSDLSSVNELSTLDALPSSAMQPSSKGFKPDLLKPPKNVDPDTLKPPKDVEHNVLNLANAVGPGDLIPANASAPGVSNPPLAVVTDELSLSNENMVDISNTTNGVVTGELNPLNTNVSRGLNPANAAAHGETNPANAITNDELNPFNSDQLYSVPFHATATQTLLPATELLSPPLLSPTTLPAAPILLPSTTSPLAAPTPTLNPTPASTQTSAPVPVSAELLLLRPPSPVAAFSLPAPLLPSRYVPPSVISDKDVADSAKIINSTAVVASNRSQTEISNAHLQDPPLENPGSPRDEQNINMRGALRFTTFASDLVRFVDPVFPAVPTYQPMEEPRNQQENRNSNMADDKQHQKTRTALTG